MDEITMRDRTSGSVWGIAAFAVAAFVIAVTLFGMFGDAELAVTTANAVK